MILSILEQTLMFMPLIMGAYITLSLLKLPDFSIESAYLFGAVMGFLAKDLPLPLVLMNAVGGGMIVGLTVCFLNQILRIPFLLAAIVTNGLFHGVTQYCLGTSNATLHVTLPFSELSLLIGIAIMMLVLLSCVMQSELGFSFAVFGNNPQFFRHHGMSTKHVVFSGVILGHGCAGISGFLFAQSNGFVDLTMNFGVILLCLTALMLGKFIHSSLRPNIFTPLLGVLAFFLVQQTLLRVGLNLKYFNAFQALFILLILYLEHKKQPELLDHLGV